MNQDEHDLLENIQEIIGEAATWLMKSSLPVDAGNLLMVLRARSIMVKEEQQKRMLEASISYLKTRLVKPV